MKPNNATGNRRQRDRLIFVKILLLLAAMLLGYFCMGYALDLPVAYAEDPEIFRNVLVQGPRFQLEKSLPFRTEMDRLFHDIADYALVYQDLENFPNADYLLAQEQQETARAEEMIQITLEILDYEIRENAIDETHVEEGFLTRTVVNGVPVYAINRAAIDAFYYGQRDQMIEAAKMSYPFYQKIHSELEDLHGAVYALYDREHERLFTNTGCTDPQALQTLFEKKPNHLLRINGAGAQADTAVTKPFCKALDAIAAAQNAPFDFYFAFGDTFSVTAACAAMPAAHTTMFRRMQKQILLSAVLLLCSAVVTRQFLRLCGRRHKNDRIRLNAFDKLPNVLHLLLLLIPLAVQVGYTVIQIDFLLHPEIITGIVLAPDLFVFRSKLCAAAFMFWLLLLLGFLRRQRKNKTLVKNLLRYHKPAAEPSTPDDTTAVETPGTDEEGQISL